MLLRGFIDKTSPIELVVLIALMILFLVVLEMVVVGVAWAEYAEPYPSERTVEYMEDELGDTESDDDGLSGY